MKKEIVSEIRNAYNDYTLNNFYIDNKSLISYIKTRIIANKKEYEELIKIYDEKIKFEDILDIFENKLEDKMNFSNLKNTLYNNDFVYATVKDSIGLICIECFETLEVIKYLYYAIQFKNAVVISDVEFDENNLKTFTIMIIKEALKKYKINENIVSIYPLEEVNYEDFDEIIYTYNKEGILLEEPKIVYKSKVNKLYIYLEDDLLKNDANAEAELLKQKGENVEIIKGDFETTLKLINNNFYKGASIYTRDVNLAYKFLNLVKANNVFINASFVNMKNETLERNEWLYRKNIIFQLPKQEFDDSKFAEMEYEVEKKLEKLQAENDEKELNNEKMLIVKKEGIFEKIKLLFKKIFKS